MRKPCIVKPLLTMQGFSFAGRLFLLSAASGFAQGNRIYWLCGKSNANRAGSQAAFSDFHAPGFAQRNRIYWLCGKSGANRAGSRAAFSDFQARSRHQYAWRMASMMFSAPTMEIPARVNLLFFFGRIIFS